MYIHFENVQHNDRFFAILPSNGNAVDSRIDIHLIEDMLANDVPSEMAVYYLRRSMKSLDRTSFIICNYV